MPLGATVADQVVVLKFEQGSFEQGFTLALQVGGEGARPSAEMTGCLPSAVHLRRHYQRWQTTYERLGLPSRIKPVVDQVTNVSRLDDCLQAANVLRQSMNDWLCAAAFRPLREKLLEQLSPGDRIRILLQTDDLQLQKLPWHTWDLLERYPLTEIALAAPTYANPPTQARSVSADVRILAILGNSDGIDLSADQALLEQLPGAHIHFLDEPNRQQLNEQLWEQHWDILFFAGHSCSQGATSGTLCLNGEESLEIEDLRYALKQAVGNGLQLAILNSCDGLGLGRSLADLQIPQLVVMREPVPDPVAQEFLKYFLQSYAKGTPLYLSMREARERLQGLEQIYPCATWLPVICQNPAVVPPTWQQLSTQEPLSLEAAALRVAVPPLPKTPLLAQRVQRWRQVCLAVMKLSFLMTALVLAGRWIGLLQFPEFWALDRLLQLRPLEPPDSRLLVITVSEAEIQAQGEDSRRSSISDSTLSQLLATLALAQPRVIGLDVYRDFPVRVDQPRLSQQLLETSALVGVCKNIDTSSDPTGIAPPPEIPMNRMGFSDFIADPDGVLRRQLLYLTPEPASPCTTPYAFSSLLAFHYLAHLKIQPTFTAQNQLKLGSFTFPTLRPHRGGYHNVDTNGIQIPLNYRALQSPQNIAPQVTLTQVLKGQIEPSRIKDKIVMIGVVAGSSSDDWGTPYGLGSKVPGVFLQAQMTSQLLSSALDGRPSLDTWPLWGDAVWIFCWSTVCGTWSWRWLEGRTRVIAGITTFAALIGSCLVLLVQGLWLPLIPTVIACVATTLMVAYSRTLKQTASIGT